MMMIYLTWCKSLYGPNLLCILVHLPSPCILLHILWFGWAQQRSAVLYFIAVLTKLGMLLKPLHIVLAAVPITDYI
jgi:hypothetical protein